MMNEFERFLGRILAKTCLKMDYFGSKSPKIASPCLWQLGALPLPLAAGGFALAFGSWGLCPPGPHSG